MDLRRRMGPILALIDHSWRSLIDLDLSWCNLGFQNFKDLCDCLKQIGLRDAEIYNGGIKKGTLRSLNLSYNPCLAPNELAKPGYEITNQSNMIEDMASSLKNDYEAQDADDVVSTCSQHSYKDNKVPVNFMQALISLVKSRCLNKCTHMDLSGIHAINPKNLVEIVNELVEFDQCSNLLALHLNDLGLNFNQEIKDEVQDIFHITDEAQQNAPQKDLHTAFRIFIDKVKGGMKQKKEHVDKLNYVNVIKTTLGQDSTQVDPDSKFNIILSQQMSNLSEKNILKTAGLQSQSKGIGRSCHHGSGFDKFVVSRKAINMPELIFNQNSSSDFQKKRRFFDLDQEMKWQLKDNNCSQKDVCYICEKQQYTIVFY